MEFTQILGTRIMGQLLQERKNMVGEIKYIWRKIIVDFLAYSSNNYVNPFYLHIEIQSGLIKSRGMPLKVVVVEA